MDGFRYLVTVFAVIYRNGIKDQVVRELLEF